MYFSRSAPRVESIQAARRSVTSTRALTRRISAALFAATALFPSLARAQDEPWREPQDTMAALFASDRYAWRLFIALNWPADPARRAPDPAKAFGADGPVTWEVWRSALNTVPDTTFPLNGGDPGDWLAHTTGPVVANERTQRFEGQPRQQRVFAAMQAAVRGRGNTVGPAPAFEGPAVEAFGSEVRFNKATYEFIRANRLYNRQGVMAAAATGAPILVFPPESKAVKALWRQIAEADKPRYHWTAVRTTTGQTVIWGLTAMHITTKDLPNWGWATFEHIDSKSRRPPRPGFGDEPPNDGWEQPTVDRAACPQPPHNCEGIPSGMGLEGTKWANYRLRGVQVDFVDSVGVPTILSNSQIERSFQRSSCITCHADATSDRNGNGLPFVVTAIGAPDPNKFRDPRTGQRLFMQLDFLWSLQMRPQDVQ